MLYYINIKREIRSRETGDAIMAGYNVCPEHSFGDVNITNGAHVILDGESDVLLDKRVTVELGSSLEVR